MKKLLIVLLLISGFASAQTFDFTCAPPDPTEITVPSQVKLTHIGNTFGPHINTRNGFNITDLVPNIESVVTGKEITIEGYDRRWLVESVSLNTSTNKYYFHTVGDIGVDFITPRRVFLVDETLYEYQENVPVQGVNLPVIYRTDVESTYRGSITVNKDDSSSGNLDLSVFVSHSQGSYGIELRANYPDGSYKFYSESDMTYERLVAVINFNNNDARAFEEYSPWANIGDLSHSITLDGNVYDRIISIDEDDYGQVYHNEDTDIGLTFRLDDESSSPYYGQIEVVIWSVAEGSEDTYLNGWTHLNTIRTPNNKATEYWLMYSAEKWIRENPNPIAHGATAGVIINANTIVVNISSGNTIPYNLYSKIVVGGDEYNIVTYRKNSKGNLRVGIAEVSSKSYSIGTPVQLFRNPDYVEGEISLPYGQDYSGGHYTNPYQYPIIVGGEEYYRIFSNNTTGSVQAYYSLNDDKTIWFFSANGGAAARIYDGEYTPTSGVHSHKDISFLGDSSIKEKNEEGYKLLLDELSLAVDSIVDIEIEILNDPSEDFIRFAVSGLGESITSDSSWVIWTGLGSSGVTGPASVASLEDNKFIKDIGNPNHRGYEKIVIAYHENTGDFKWVGYNIWVKP